MAASVPDMRDVSILILSRNGAGTLPRLLDAIAAQEFDGIAEIVAVDSGSTDGSVEILRPRVGKLIEIDAATFNHGETRNVGIAAASHPCVVLIVQDAIPANPHWLRELVAPLRASPRVAASWSRQIPFDAASAITRRYLESWLGASREPRVAAIPDAAAFERLSPWKRYEQCAFDNVCSCIRRTAWERHPFPRVPIGEDMEWAREVLLAGHQIAYAPASAVYHSHERSAAYEFRRTLLIHYRLRALFGLSTVPGVFALLRSMAATARAHVAYLRQDTTRDHPAREWARALALAVAWPAGQYAGARLADRGVRVNGFRGI